MPRVCLTRRVRPDRPAEDRERHAAARPEMLFALGDAGRRDHQLFLRDDGPLVFHLDAQPAALSPASPATTAPIGETP